MSLFFLFALLVDCLVLEGERRENKRKGGYNEMKGTA